MKKIILILTILSVASCSSEKSVERETNKSKQIVVQKFLDEYTKKHTKLTENISANSLKNSKSYIDFIHSKKNIRMAKTALKNKEGLSESQIIQLNEIIKRTK